MESFEDSISLDYYKEGEGKQALKKADDGGNHNLCIAGRYISVSVTVCLSTGAIGSVVNKGNAIIFFWLGCS